MARLAAHGFSSYEDYLRSDAWRERRARIGEAVGWRCPCGGRATQVHHVTYARVCEERDEDLIALCAGCHKEIHRRVKRGASLALATNIVTQRRAGVVVLPPARRPKSKKSRRRKARRAKPKTPRGQRPTLEIPKKLQPKPICECSVPMLTRRDRCAKCGKRVEARRV